MKKRTLLSVLCFSIFCQGCATTTPAENTQLPDTTHGDKAIIWVTNGSQAKLLKQDNAVTLIKGNNPDASSNLININFGTKLQEMEGFGAALTGSSAYLLNRKMSAAQRKVLLKELFDVNEGIGISYLRVTMGASDFSLEDFTYDDLPIGQTDAKLDNFSVAKDQDDLIPLLKEVLKLQPAIRIMATPWSAPAWMKSNGKLAGGSLKSEWYPAFALYFVKYLNEYKKEGITIDAVSVQNEPLHEATYPSMRMDAQAQNVFIRDHLGPLLQTNTLKTKILIYDHNWDRPDFPLTLLNDAKTNPFVTGSAFHAYGGSVSAMSEVHDKFPDKGLYFTEISGGRWATNFSDNLKWNMANIFIGTANNWSKNALLWNLALDDNDGPKNKGCDNCRGVVTISKDGSFIKNVEYYAIAHMSRFVKPGAFRVQSDKFSAISNLESVAFLNTDGTKVLVVLNQSAEGQRFTVSENSQSYNYTIEPNSLATIVWK